MKELGIYVHIPFCKSKCSYCDFVSFANSKNCIENYIEALKKEIKMRLNNIKKANISTIYIGGGTPSYIEERYIEDIVNTLKDDLKINLEKCEITIEVNPGTVTEEKMKKYIEIGINRISIGLQTANDNLLKEIGRIHTYSEFLETYELAKKVGFANINVDLMLGLPNQTVTDLNNSVEEIINLKPKHISVYSLIVEEGTKLSEKLSKGEIKLPSEEIERKMYWNIKKKLEQNEYNHYEISNFSKTNFESKHNLNCWNQKEYLGFGIAAHSYYNNKRYSNTSKLDKYISNIANINEIRTINEIQTTNDKEKEFMLLGLRKIEGVDIQEFKNKFIDNPIYIFRKEIEKLTKQKLIEIDLNNIKLTNKGIDFANIVWEEFV